MSQLFLFLRRTKTKPAVESDEGEVSIPEVEVPEEVPETCEVEGNDIERVLTRARFPIRARAELLKLFGGPEAEISVGTKVYIAGEIADRCFAGRTSLNSNREVIEAFNETSWIKVVMEKLHMLPFPVDTKEQLAGRLRGTYVDGVPILDLIDDLEFPVNSPSDLLAQLARPRSSQLTQDQFPEEDGIKDESYQGEEIADEAEGEEQPTDNPLQLAGETSV
jgi:hypothetical protein